MSIIISEPQFIALIRKVIFRSNWRTKYTRRAAWVKVLCCQFRNHHCHHREAAPLFTSFTCPERKVKSRHSFPFSRQREKKLWRRHHSPYLSSINTRRAVSRLFATFSLCYLPSLGYTQCDVSTDGDHMREYKGGKIAPLSLLFRRYRRDMEAKQLKCNIFDCP